MSELRSLHYLKAFGYDFLEHKDHHSFENTAFNLDSEQRKAKLHSLQKQILKCQLCPLSKKRKKTPINDTFNQVRLMIISEFINKKENESGQNHLLFQDQNLEEILKNELALSKDELYFSYIYKCFNNEKSDQNALNQCLPYIFEETMLLSPKLILILGQGAYECLKLKDFKQKRGIIFNFYNATSLASFDAHFISKNPSFMPLFIKDLQKFKPFL